MRSMFRLGSSNCGVSVPATAGLLNGQCPLPSVQPCQYQLDQIWQRQSDDDNEPVKLSFREPQRDFSL
jgi:hypothetical protein